MFIRNKLSEADVKHHAPLADVTRRAMAAVGDAGYSRTDIRSVGNSEICNFHYFLCAVMFCRLHEKNGVYYILEVNTNCG